VIAIGASAAATTEHSFRHRSLTAAGLWHNQAVAPSYEDLRFEGLFDFLGRTWRAAVRPEPIVYRLRVWDAARLSFRPVPRAAAVDVDGILDIGESADGRRRLEDFCAAVECKPRSHRAGWEYSAMGYDFGSVFAPASLRVEFLHLARKEMAEALELALLEDYRWRFKDRPPLNGSAGKYRKVDAWLREQGRAPRDADGWLDLSGLLPASTGGRVPLNVPSTRDRIGRARSTQSLLRAPTPRPSTHEPRPSNGTGRRPT
jgi:hypothetical protein